jgi:predicted nucleic acid-binding protein
VSRSLVDTNIISNVTKPVPSDALVAWMAEQADEDLFISALTVAEIHRRSRPTIDDAMNSRGARVSGFS